MTLDDFEDFEELLLAFGREGAVVRIAVELAATDPPAYEKLLDMISRPNLSAPQIVAELRERVVRGG